MYNRILVTLDGSALAEQVLPHVVNLATRSNAEVTLLRVFTPGLPMPEVFLTPLPLEKQEAERQIMSEYSNYLERIADDLRSAGVSQVNTAIEIGDPAERIVDFAESQEVDLIAMSTHGRTGIKRWVYGSVASRVLQAASAPILLIRSKG